MKGVRKRRKIKKCVTIKKKKRGRLKSENMRSKEKREMQNNKQKDEGWNRKEGRK